MHIHAHTHTHMHTHTNSYVDAVSAKIEAITGTQTVASFPGPGLSVHTASNKKQSGNRNLQSYSGVLLLSHIN